MLPGWCLAGQSKWAEVVRAPRLSKLRKRVDSLSQEGVVRRQQDWGAPCPLGSAAVGKSFGKVDVRARVAAGIHHGE
jgi:hypothetical protein